MLENGKKELKPIIIKDEFGERKMYPKGNMDWDDDPFWIVGKYLILLTVGILIVEIIITILGG